MLQCYVLTKMKESRSISTSNQRKQLTKKKN